MPADYDFSRVSVYAEVGQDDSNKVDMNMAFTGEDTQRKWDIKVAQLLCGSPSAPPSGCLQWFTDRTGQITSFNFADTAGTHLKDQL